MKKKFAIALAFILSIILLFFVAGFSGQGNCLDGGVKQDFSSEHYEYHAAPGKIITGIGIKAGPTCYFDSVPGCYVVSGVGTNWVEVDRISDGNTCKEISHVEFALSTDTSTATNTPQSPTQTPKTPTNTPRPTNTPKPPTATPTSTVLVSPTRAIPLACELPEPTATPVSVCTIPTSGQCGCCTCGLSGSLGSLDGLGEPQEIVVVITVLVVYPDGSDTGVLNGSTNQTETNTNIITSSSLPNWFWVVIIGLIVMVFLAPRRKK